MANEQQGQKPEKSERWKKQQERLRRVAQQKQVRRVRVHPRDDDIRRDLKHGVTNVAFPAEGSVEWPYDQFTVRRLRDGDVKLENEGEQKQRDEQRQQDQRRPQQRPQQQSQPPQQPPPQSTPQS